MNLGVLLGIGGVDVNARLHTHTYTHTCAGALEKNGLL